MIVDGRTLENAAHLEADVAVVGAGPAGIVVALELADSGRRVILLESGGTGHDPIAQRLGDTVGNDPHHAPMEQATQRAIGGASNLWGGRCVPFDPVDFEPRGSVQGAEWPIGYEEVARYFQRACDWCVCGQAQFDARDIPGLAGRSIVPGFRDGELLASSLERWSLPTRFGDVYRKRLEESQDLTLVTGLTCTEISCVDEGDAVDHLEAQTLDGRRVRIQAREYVVACGGLESTRLLFASNKIHPEGLGNHSGHLGRWYMAHVTSRIAKVRFSTPLSETIYGHERDQDGVYVRRRFSFSRRAQAEHDLPNAVLWLVNPKLSDATHGSGELSFVYLMLISPLGHRFIAEAIRRDHTEGDGPVRIWPHLRNVLKSPASTLRFALGFGYRRFLRRGRKAPGFFVPIASNSYPLQYHGEHLPNANSYVRPSGETDAMGVPRLETNLEFGDEDVAGVLRAHEVLDRNLREQGLGHLEYADGDPAGAVRSDLTGGLHQAGTTRMSSRPEDGVVDGRLAVHGVDNLHVASSSVFVTSGQANSTFMIIALAVRLADHLGERLGSRESATLVGS